MRIILTKNTEIAPERYVRGIERRSCREKSGLFNCCRRQQLPPVPDWSHCWWLSQVESWKHCNSKLRHMENYFPKRERSRWPSRNLFCRKAAANGDDLCDEIIHRSIIPPSFLADPSRRCLKFWPIFKLFVSAKICENMYKPPLMNTLWT